MTDCDYAADVINKLQSRAARALTEMEQKDLAERASVSRRTIMRFESGKTVHRSVAIAIERALTEAGVVFIDAGPDGGPGVRLREPRQ